MATPQEEPIPDDEDERRRRREREEEMERLIMEQEMMMMQEEEEEHHHLAGHDEQHRQQLDEDGPFLDHPPEGHHDHGAEIPSSRRPIFNYTQWSFLSLVILLFYALRTRGQFYTACVFLSSNKMAYVIGGNALIAFLMTVFRFLIRVFLDKLRPLETETIAEQFRWYITETCLALTMFRDEVDVNTCILFIMLVSLKCLHWAGEIREGHFRMTQETFVFGASPNSIWRGIPRMRSKHFKLVVFLVLLLTVDVWGILYCGQDYLKRGPTVKILFGFEAAIMAVGALSSLMLYQLHAIDGMLGLWHQYLLDQQQQQQQKEAVEQGAVRQQAEIPQSQEAGERQEGENTTNAETTVPPPPPPRSLLQETLQRTMAVWRDHRATLTFVVELQAQALKFLFYVSFFAIVLTYYGMPINLFREVYVSFQHLKRRLAAFAKYRQLTHNLGTRFESVSDQQELTEGGTSCIICREQMFANAGDANKKLPGCGHIFHKTCLREWLVQQQSCPTCRGDILAMEARAKKQKEMQRARELQEQQQQREQEEALAQVETNSDAVNDAKEPTGLNAAKRERGIELPDSTLNTRSEPIDTSRSAPTPPANATSVGETEKTLKEPLRGAFATPTKTAPPELEFPCLYKVINPGGASVFDTNDNEIRKVQGGRIVLCLGLEFKNQLKIPDGWVRLSDMERMYPIVRSSDGKVISPFKKE